MKRHSLVQNSHIFSGILSALSFSFNHRYCTHACWPIVPTSYVAHWNIHQYYLHVFSEMSRIMWQTMPIFTLTLFSFWSPPSIFAEDIYRTPHPSPIKGWCTRTHNSQKQAEVQCQQIRFLGCSKGQKTGNRLRQDRQGTGRIKGHKPIIHSSQWERLNTEEATTIWQRQGAEARFKYTG